MKLKNDVDITKFKRIFSKRLRKCLVDKNIKKLSKQLKISENTMISWRYGSRTPHLFQLIKLLDLLPMEDTIGMLYSNEKIQEFIGANHG